MAPALALQVRVAPTPALGSKLVLLDAPTPELFLKVSTLAPNSTGLPPDLVNATVMALSASTVAVHTKTSAKPTCSTCFCKVHVSDPPTGVANTPGTKRKTSLKRKRANCSRR